MSMKLVLQGGGRMALVASRDMRQDEAGAMMDALRAHDEEGRPISLFHGVDEIIDNRPLNERNVTPIVTHDRSSGKYHERYIVVQANGNERTVVDERCQADQSGSFIILEAVPDSADSNSLCRYCFPPVEVEREHTAGPI